MNRMVACVLVCVLSLCLLGCLTCADDAARLGAVFSEAYLAFGPIHALHAVYEAYLFEGILPTVPSELGDACDGFLQQLAQAHLLFATQTASLIVAPAMWINLRVYADAFCLAHGETLQSISCQNVLSAERLQTASETGLFPAIFDLRELLGQAFTETFEDLPDDEARWRFSVAFSTTALALRSELARIDDDLGAIFYGGEGRTEPPFAVAEDIQKAMERLIELSGRDLELSEIDEVRDLATRVVNAFTFMPRG